MNFDEYQDQAKKTDQFSNDKEKISPMLRNLTEDVGSLSRLIEQEMRDKNLPDEYVKDRITLKAGDILWYLANIATRNGIELSKIASRNLERTHERWGTANELKGKLFDEKAPSYEKIPRKFQMAFFEPLPESSPRKIIIALPSTHDEWIQVGDRIDDNASEEDGYRFHDVFHLAHAAYLGWSPVVRALFKRKRKSLPEMDRVEDGARAINIEEALTALVFAHARSLDYFEKAEHVEFAVLKTVERITRGLEVQHRSYQDWENAIIYGYKAFRELRKRQEALISVDLQASLEERISFSDLPITIKAGVFRTETETRP